jgi:hypothetical protein
LITESISAVAVCCSKASRVSLISRAFSIAMTACAAKLSSKAISLSENGPGSRRAIEIVPGSASSLRSATTSRVRGDVKPGQAAGQRHQGKDHRQ